MQNAEFEEKLLVGSVRLVREVRSIVSQWLEADDSSSISHEDLVAMADSLRNLGSHLRRVHLAGGAEGIQKFARHFLFFTAELAFRRLHKDDDLASRKEWSERFFMSEVFEPELLTSDLVSQFHHQGKLLMNALDSTLGTLSGFIQSLDLDALPRSGFLGGEELSRALGVSEDQKEAFKKKLSRSRVQLGDENWVEVADPQQNVPKYLYRLDAPPLLELAARYLGSSRQS